MILLRIVLRAPAVRRIVPPAPQAPVAHPAPVEVQVLAAQIVVQILQIVQVLAMRM